MVAVDNVSVIEKSGNKILTKGFLTQARKCLRHSHINFKCCLSIEIYIYITLQFTQKRTSFPQKLQWIRHLCLEKYPTIIKGKKKKLVLIFIILTLLCMLTSAQTKSNSHSQKVFRLNIKPHKLSKIYSLRRVHIIIQIQIK